MNTDNRIDLDPLGTRSFCFFLFLLFTMSTTEREIKRRNSRFCRKDPIRETEHRDEARPGPAGIGSMASANIGGDMFWNTPLSSVPMSRFLWVYLGGGFFPRAYQEGIYVSCYPVFCCSANHAHRKKFWPVETRNFDEFLFLDFHLDPCHLWSGRNLWSTCSQLNFSVRLHGFSYKSRIEIAVTNIIHQKILRI